LLCYEKRLKEMTLAHLRIDHEVKSTTSKKKRKCLLACARKGMLLEQANDHLKQGCLDPITPEDWALWTNYYVGIVRDDPYFENELINNDRSLAWFALKLNERRNKLIIS